MYARAVAGQTHNITLTLGENIMRLLPILLLSIASASVSAQIEQRTMTIDAEHVANWNAFADNLLKLHARQLQGRNIQKKEIIGGYFRNPDFYREEQYYDADSGLLLSRVVWEREHPDRLHEIEVFVHDKQGRVIRDYLARYLPQGRNAPVQTLINLHAWHGGVHSFRQFDASNNRIYESCRGRLADDEIFIDLEEDQLLGGDAAAMAVMDSLDYNVCFDGLPLSASAYLTPH